MANILLRSWKGVGGLGKVLQHCESLPGTSHGCAFAGELLEREGPSKIIWFPMHTLQLFLSYHHPEAPHHPGHWGRVAKSKARGYI